jgi:hypothetical protein
MEDLNANVTKKAAAWPSTSSLHDAAPTQQTAGDPKTKKAKTGSKQARLIAKLQSPPGDRLAAALSTRLSCRRGAQARLIGSLRHDCLDHVLIFGERHLRGVLSLYAGYYNETRTHLGLGKDTPLRRAIQRSGTIVTTPILSGLHHRYARI